MSKVYIHMKRDPGIGLLIPHNLNFASAMYGFLEMGYEVIPYESVLDIYDKVTREDIVIDYIDQCESIFSRFGKKAILPNYPERLSKYLGRKVWTDTINAFSSDPEKWKSGWFIKPIRNKAFTGKVIHSLSDLIGCGNQHEDYEILVSEPISIMGEWRGFILNDRILDVRPYGSLTDYQKGYEGYKAHYSEKTIDQMMADFRLWKGRPVACSMDICVTKDGRTLLLEMNDAYSLGSYGLPSILYAKMLEARWNQIMET